MKKSVRFPYSTEGYIVDMQEVVQCKSAGGSMIVLLENMLQAGCSQRRTRAQLLLLEAEALDLVEVVAGLLGRHIVGGHARDGLVAGVVRGVEHQCALSGVHLAHITGSQGSPAPG